VINGTPGDDTGLGALIDTLANDMVNGLGGADSLSGLAGNDPLSGGDSNDTLQGGSGDDVIAGGTGIDRAIFAGNRADYSIVTLAGVTTVTDLQPTLNGNDGADTLTGVRLLQFLDQVFVINVAPMAGADAAATNEDTQFPVSLASLLANHSDADGDALSITGIAGVTGGAASIVGSNLVFTPNPGQFGSASFTYTIADDRAARPP
jgi:hypothetical protein